MDWLSPIKEFFDFALPVIDKVPVVRAIIGTLLVFFLPGFAWTLVFFKEFQFLERLVFSFALSIVFVTLTIIFTNVVFHIRITGLNSLLTIIIITVIPLAIFHIGKRRRVKKT